MIIKLSNGNEIVLKDVVMDPKAASLQWLRNRKEEKEDMAKINEMNATECYNELDRLREKRRTEGRGHNPDAAQMRHYCDVRKEAVRTRLRHLGAPLTRPGDGRVYGPGQARWQRAGGMP